MQKYVCDVCGWIYDPAENDNVAFEDLQMITCPACGVGKDMFSQLINLKSWLNNLIIKAVLQQPFLITLTIHHNDTFFNKLNIS